MPELTDDPELAGEARYHTGVAILESNRSEEGEDPQPVSRATLNAAGEELGAVQGSFRARAFYRYGFAALTAGTALQDSTASASERTERESEQARLMLESAQEAFQEIAGLDGDPLQNEARYLLGETRSRMGNMAGALEPLRALLDAEPEHERGQAARLRRGELQWS